MITGSIHNVYQRKDNGIIDRYLNCGQTVLTRQFNPLIFQTGSWNEIWIGFRWNVNFFPRSQSISVDHDLGNFSFGICRTDGFVFGQSGSSGSILSHYLGLIMSDRREISNFRPSILSHSFLNFSTQSALVYNVAIQHVSGTNIDNHPSLGLFPYTILPSTTNNTSSRNPFFCRFVTGSIPPSWSFSILCPIQSMWSIDVSSSAYMAELMKQPTWNFLTQSAFSFFPGGFTYVNQNNYISVNQSSSGYFDGIYFSWDKYYSNIELSDVVLRLK